ncbi:MAG: protein kinase [Planctomycetes bacterium]|nr:protein kinase [Planctomycetota bacterium]
MHKLERALTIYEEWLAADRSPPSEELLARHPDVAELLRAMVADRTGVEHAAAEAEREQRVLGEFRIVAEIGRGGMGVVYRAVQRSLGREVALKVLAAHVTLAPSAVARFKREANLAARLEHPGIVRILAVGGDGDTHWFAMELVDGVPMARVDPTTGATRSIRDCVEACAAVCDALAHAHAHGVLHRDVKPSNVLVRADGRVVLTDFGLARELDDPGITRTGAFAGTPRYAAPEQIAGRREIDARADVFALGAMLYALVTGRPPFAGDSVAEVLDRIARTEPADPLRLEPELAPDLAAIVMKAIEKEPNRRYTSAAVFGDDLRAFLEFRPIVARRASPWTRIARWARREPFRAALAFTLLIGVPTTTGVIGYLLANRTTLELGAERKRALAREERLARITIDYEAGDYPSALAAADQAVAAEPRDIEARVLRALAQLAGGRRDSVLEQLAAADSGDPAAEKRGRALVLAALDRGNEAAAIEAQLDSPRTPEQYFLAACTATLRAQQQGSDAGEWRHVRDLFTSAMLLLPTPRLHYHLRWVAATQQCGTPDEVAAAVRVLRTLWPDSPAALLYVAYSLVRSDPAQAVVDYERVLAAGYDHPRIHSTIGNCLERLGDKDGAAAARRRAVASFRARVAAGRATPDDHVNVAITLAGLGERTEAIAAARGATVAFPKLARAFTVLGWLLEEDGDREGAATAYRHNTELMPADPEPVQRLGRVLLGLGDPNGAATSYRRWCELRPDAPAAHYNLGRALLAGGDVAGARAAFERALGLAKTDEERGTIETGLRGLEQPQGR